jgi:hypothetical protein
LLKDPETNLDSYPVRIAIRAGYSFVHLSVGPAFGIVLHPAALSGFAIALYTVSLAAPGIVLHPAPLAIFEIVLHPAPLPGFGIVLLSRAVCTLCRGYSVSPRIHPCSDTCAVW